MLPNRMQLNKAVEEQLKKLKSQTGITPNIASRIAFFRSIEFDYLYKYSSDSRLNGLLVLDKYTWLGKTTSVIELILEDKYPDFDIRKLHHAWAGHVEFGLASLRNHKKVSNLIKELYLN